MEDVAKAVGVARSTVSKALRDDPSISVRRREEIRRQADKLGYRPNPMVATLMAQLHSRRRRSDPHHIAWVDLWPDDRKARIVSVVAESLLSGARERAAQLGYNIEVYRTTVDRISPARLRQILMTRSQWGLIIPPVPDAMMNYTLNMEGLTGVGVGLSLHEPVLHRVSPNHYQGGRLACQQLRAKGFRRIGFAIDPTTSERGQHRWLAAYLAEQYHWTAAERLPPLLVEASDSDRFYAWLRKHNPDAILVSEPYVPGWLASFSRSRKKAPKVAWLLRPDKPGKHTWGIDGLPDQLGAAAVELVIGQIHRNERGCPDTARTLLIDGVWSEE